MTYSTAQAPLRGVPSSMKDEDTVDLSQDDFDAHWDAKFDAIARVYSLRPGQVLTQEDFDAIQKFDADYRENEETALQAFNSGYRRGLTDGGSADIAKLSEKLNAKAGELSLAKTLSKFRFQWGFREGAAACREMIARFVEQGGHHDIATSIRANWHPGWGDNPPAPDKIPASADFIEAHQDAPDSPQDERKP